MNQSSINNPQVSEFSKTGSSQLKQNAQMLRVKAGLQLKKIQDIWNISQENLIQYFQYYQTIPYSRISCQWLFKIEKVKMIRTQHKMYFGEIYQKKKQGKGIAIYRKGKLYEGEFHLNQKSGHGVEIYENGNVYVGNFSQNKKHGRGSFFWFSLCQSEDQKQIEQYHGDWWGGLPDGIGQHSKNNGDVYVGMFKNGLKHGQGTEIYGNGDKYKGQFVNGLPQGYGQYYWCDGAKFKGDFKQGSRNGYGIWKSGMEGNQNYKGHYMLDKKHGYGIYNWGNGYVYKGFWMDDLRYGEGQLLFNNQIQYNGYWQNGERVNYKPDMNKLNIDMEDKLRKATQTTSNMQNKTVGAQSKITDRGVNSMQKKKPNPRNTSADRQRSSNKEEFSMSFNRSRDHSHQNSHSRSKCGHKNCIPTQEIGKMPRPPWKNAWKK